MDWSRQSSADLWLESTSGQALLVNGLPYEGRLRLLREGQLGLAPARDWELLWQGGRSGDYRVFYLFRKRDPAVPAR